jgi:hypothetical protein
MNNGLMDFYYSRKVEIMCEKTYGDDYIRARFKGIPFTESTEHGKEPRTLEVGDLILLGSGTLDDCNFTVNGTTRGSFTI